RHRRVEHFTPGGVSYPSGRIDQAVLDRRSPARVSGHPDHPGRSGRHVPQGESMNVIHALTLVAALAQTPPAPLNFKASVNPLSDAVRGFAARYSRNLVQSAELMPPDKYGFHPTEPQMTFAQLMVHVVQTNVALCSGIAGEAAPMTADELRKLTTET